MADCEILASNDFKFNHNKILEDLKDNSAWNREASEEENKEGSWYRFLSAARGMLHQYTGQQYSNINGHYSPLNSCSQLVQQTYSQASKITEINDCDSEQSGYFNEEKFSPNESEESQTQRFEAKDSKELVPNTAEVQDKCDNETSQMINDEQNNNNVQKSQIKSEPFNYQKYTAASEENDIIPFIDLDMETIINAPAEENEEYKQKLQSTANEINKICDENESNFRLPGFHQAFGSTEIGRYVHQKDFIEQTATQSIIMHQSKTMMLQCQTAINGVPNGLSSPKTKSRVCNKRIKTPIETNTRPAPCWNYEHESDSPAVCTPPNGGYYKRKDMMRRTKPNQQNCENNSSSVGYYSDEYYNCPSPYYGGGCTDYPNCDYYRYQQNSHSHSHSQYQNYNNASYNTHSNYNMNNYTEEHSQRLSSYGASSMSYSHNQNWRGERYFPYAEQFQSYRYRQGSSSPYYQQFVSPNQHMQTQQSFNYGYNSYPPVPNYNYF